MTCGSCGWPLPANKLCPRCRYGAQMSWEAIARVYAHRNPGDPITGAQAKAAFESAMRKLRADVRFQNECGRLLLGLRRDSAA